MQKNRKEKPLAGNSLLLLLTAVIWGMAFVSQSKGMDYMHPFTFNGVRALIGAFVLFVYIVVSRRLAGNRAKPICWGVTLRAGLWCGLALTVASTLQQFGIKYTTVGKAGFITTLYIIFVPLAGIFFKRRVSVRVWIAAVLATVGMYLLCMTESLRLGLGDILIFFVRWCLLPILCWWITTRHRRMESLFLVSSLRFVALSAESVPVYGESRSGSSWRREWGPCYMPVF